MADFEAKVPEWIEDAIHDLGKRRERFASRHHLPLMEKHEIDVALRVQLRAAETSQCDQGQRRKFLECLRRKRAFRRFPQIAEQNIDQRRAATADLPAARSSAMQDLEPMRFYL